MREHLYRAKRKDNGKWVYGCICYNDNNGEPLICPQYDFSVEVIPETIGQYTGLTDKNGNKIFEGDIVSLGDLSAIKICGCYVVKWDNEQCRFSMYLNGIYEQAGFNKDTMKSYQIIGNIYENEELINADL